MEKFFSNTFLPVECFIVVEYTNQQGIRIHTNVFIGNGNMGWDRKQRIRRELEETLEVF